MRLIQDNAENTAIVELEQKVRATVQPGSPVRLKDLRGKLDQMAKMLGEDAIVYLYQRHYPNEVITISNKKEGV